MSNTPSAGAVGVPGSTASPLPEGGRGGGGSSSMAGLSTATPPTQRLITRKRASSRTPLGMDGDIATSMRRSSREPVSTTVQEDDPSSTVPARGLDFGKDPAQGDIISEKAVHRASSKSGSAAVDINASRGESQPAKPKLLKLSLQARPPRTTRPVSLPRHGLLGSFFSWWFVIFVLVAGLATTFWNWRVPEPSHFPTSMEGQVAELEEMLRKTTKMMQVQLDLVDMKIQKEIDSLKKELEERIEEQAVSFGTELRNIEAKTEDIEASLRRLTEAGFPTRQDVLNLINSVVEERATNGNGETLSLDDVRAVARRLVEVELEKHAADGIGKVDYALASGGGKVQAHSEGFYNGLGNGLRFLTGGLLGRTNKHPLANKILEPSFGEPGQCLPLKGSSVYVEIALRTSIFPEAFSLEHVSKRVAYDISSAPKDFHIFGWLDSYRKDDPATKSATQILLGEFTYNVDKENVQTFSVPQESRGKLVNMVRLEVLSNYGSPSHTCIYRLRVHGSDPQSMLLGLG